MQAIGIEDGPMLLGRASRLVVLFLVSLAAACAFKVKLVGEYDEITDKAVSELHKKTASFIAKLKGSAGSDRSYSANKKFYEDVQGDVAALILRAKVIEEGLKGNPLTRNFEALKDQYADLEAQHKRASILSELYIRSSNEAFEQSFRAIVGHLLFLKWNQTQPEAKKQ